MTIPANILVAGLIGWLASLGFLLAVSIDASRLAATDIWLMAVAGVIGLGLAVALGKRLCGAADHRKLVLVVYVVLYFTGVYSPIAAMRANASGVRWAAEQPVDPDKQGWTPRMMLAGERTMANHVAGVMALALLVTFIDRVQRCNRSALPVAPRPALSMFLSVMWFIVTAFLGWIHTRMTVAIPMGIAAWSGFAGMCVLTTLAFQKLRQTRRLLATETECAPTDRSIGNEIVVLCVCLVSLAGVWLVTWQMLEDLSVGNRADTLMRLVMSCVSIPFWALMGPVIMDVIALIDNHAQTGIPIRSLIVDLGMFTLVTWSCWLVAMKVVRTGQHRRTTIDIVEWRSAAFFGLMTGMGCLMTVSYAMLQTAAYSILTQADDFATPTSLLMFSTGHLGSAWTMWGLTAVVGGLVATWMFGPRRPLNQVLPLTMASATVAGTSQYVGTGILYSHIMFFTLPISNPAELIIRGTVAQRTVGDQWVVWVLPYVLGLITTILVWISIWAGQLAISRMILRVVFHQRPNSQAGIEPN